MDIEQLRAETFDFAHGFCEWPGCAAYATELAHITSKGMGGSRHRDTWDNVFAACWDHARVSDGQPPAGGGVAALRAEFSKVPAVDADATDGWRTRLVLEMFRGWLADQRASRVSWKYQR